MEAFLNVSNLFNKQPLVVPTPNPSGGYPTERNLYDVIGTYFTAGVRLKL
jgi:outer membrane receptor protein involved in Fe transport